MSLQLAYSVKFSSDCLSLILEDETGDYSTSNVTGYGMSPMDPNPQRSDILTTIVDITLPSGAVFSNITMTPPTANPPVTVIKSSTFGASSLSEGIYKISITETTSTNTYNKVINVLNTCSTRCCLDKLISSLDGTDCDCSNTSLKQITKIEYYLQAAIDAASCSKNTKANKLLKAAQDICAQKNCGCTK